MVYHPEFERAGKKSGLQVWRVESHNLVAVPESLHGGFYTGDAYLVLNTIKKRSGNLQYDLHYWQGDDCTVDESGAAAIFTIQMDDYLGCKPIQYREVQGCESQTFSGYFKIGLKYMKGGIASGFRHVVSKKMEMQRLLHVRGRHVVRATEVAVSWDSFNQGDVFILDLSNEISRWCGSKANSFEKLKATQVSKDICDNERCGRSELYICEEGAEHKKMLEILGPKLDLPEAIDIDGTKSDVSNRNLISDASGDMSITMVASKNPFLQSALESSEYFIGQEEPMSLTELPACLFSVTDRHFIISNPKAWNTEQKTNIWCIEGADKVPLDPSSYGQFYGRDSYIIHYKYQYGGRGAVQVRVIQGKEPAHLMSVFWDQPVIVHQGGTSREGGQAKVADTRLFQVRSNPAGSTRAVEVDYTASNLNSNDAFVLVSPAGSFMWVGKGASDSERKGAQQLSKHLGLSASVVDEFDETGTIRNNQEMGTSERLKNKMDVHPPRLFACSNKTEQFIIEEVPGEITEEDLAPDDVMILDTWEQVFVWVGGDAQEEEKTEALASAVRYIETDHTKRDGSTPIVKINQGHEPPTFTGWFLGWDHNYWNSDPLERSTAGLCV
uniref:Gelsolin n=1 Tax=Esox lucius TaxID=8010 RepID=A0A6Q2XLS1_ESOLU